MPNTATVTGKIGPGYSATTLQFSNVSGVEYKFDSKVVTIKHDGNNWTDIDISAATTVTMVLTAGNWAVTIS